MIFLAPLVDLPAQIISFRIKLDNLSDFLYPKYSRKLKFYFFTFLKKTKYFLSKYSNRRVYLVATSF